MNFSAIIGYILIIIWLYMFFHFFKAFFLSYKIGHVVSDYYKKKGKPLMFPYLPTSSAEVALYVSKDSKEMKIARQINQHKKRALIAFFIAFPLLIGIAVHTMINGECTKTQNGFKCSLTAEKHATKK